MDRSPLRVVLRIFLFGALVEDALLFVIAWVWPDLWFQLFHDRTAAGLEAAFLRRSAGQWLAFAIVQALALWRYADAPVWLPIVAGVRISDFFTDLSYVVAAPSLTTIGWVALLPPPVLNLAFALVALAMYRRLRGGALPSRG